MGMVENFKCVMDRKENKQRNYSKSENKYFVSCHDRNSENAIFWDICIILHYNMYYFHAHGIEKLLLKLK